MPEAAESSDRGGPTTPRLSARDLGLPYWVRRVGVFSWLLIGFLIAVGAVAVVFAVTSAITVPVIVAVFLAVIFAPVVTWLADRGVNRSFGAVAVLIGLTAITAFVVYLTTTALVDQADELRANLGAAVDDIKAWLDDTPISADLADQASDTAADSGPALASGLAGGAVSVLNSATALVSGIVLASIVLYYLLKEGPTRAATRSEPKDDRRALRYRVADDAVKDVRGYFRGQTLIALSNGVVIGLAALLMGVPAAAAIGIVNFFGAYIPYLGGFVGGAFAVLMALGEGGVGLAVAMLAVTLGVNLLLENLLQPVLVGGSLNIGPLPILLATTLGGMLAGMIGLVLAAPLLAIALDAHRELKSSGFFDEPDGPTSPPV
ncbi:MAG: AI-2E family transporter [Ilumatobacteraceae bacterium]